MMEIVVMTPTIVVIIIIIIVITIVNIIYNSSEGKDGHDGGKKKEWYAVGMCVTGEFVWSGRQCQKLRV